MALKSIYELTASLIELMNKLLCRDCLTLFISYIYCNQYSLRMTNNDDCFEYYRVTLQIVQVFSYNIVRKMSNFRIQRKFTEVTSIKRKIPLPQPPRIKSLQSKHSFTRSPKTIDHQSLRKLVQKIAIRRPSQQSEPQYKARLQEGIKAYRDKNVSKATEIFKQLYKNGVKSAELAFYLGSCLLNTGKHQASIMYLNECISLNQSYSPNAYLYIAVNFKMLSNLKQAIKALDSGLQLFPSFEEAVFYRAKLFMKLGDYSKAIESFYTSLNLNPANDLAVLFLGDCFRSQGKIDRALQQYLKIVKKAKKYVDLSATRIANIYIERKEYQKAYEMLSTLISKGQQNVQINLYLGEACYGLNKKQQSIIYFQSCLAGTKDMKLAFKAWKHVLKIAIDNCDFYQAEHQINRAAQFGLEEEKYKQWKVFIEGVSDLIKRKNINACLKLQQAKQIGQKKLTNPNRINQSQSQQYLKYIYRYVAYSFYINDNIDSALELYDKALQVNPQDMTILHSRVVLQGIILQAKGQYKDAIGKFQQAFTYLKRAQVLFMAAITLIRQYKVHPEKKQAVFSKAERCLVQACQCDQKTPLLLFYYALLLLYLQKPCASIINRAIQNSQESISEYFFIYALALQSQGKLKEALQAISKAIEIDSGILQFYRQRSKYYFLDEEYNLAIEDCKRAEAMDPEDEEIHLLLAFYLYLVGQYRDSWCYLRKVAPSGGKLKEFQLALCLRLGKYQKLAEIGQIITAIVESRQVDQSDIAVVVQYISQRYQFSQFSVYFYHLLLSVVYSQSKCYDKGLLHLFGCLEQIQLLIDDKQMNRSTFQVTFQQTQAMLDEIKLNITIMSLLQGDFEQTERYVNIFSKETTSVELREILNHIAMIVKDKEYQGDIELAVQNQESKLSDSFPSLRIPIHNATLITKLVVSYPVKLKFTIAPEFDPAYLYNFDIDKIQFKIPPPWLKGPDQKLNFTEDICQQSIYLSQSQRSLASEKVSSSFGRFNIVQRLKLDKSVEDRLERLMGK